jgi:AraC-like DNA-binding protein
MLTFGHRTGTSPATRAALWAGVITSTLPDADLSTATPRRLPYHLLVLTTAGQGAVEVDFVAQPCRPGTLLWVRPGQALRFGAEPTLDATLVIWEPGLLAADQVAGLPVDAPFGPAHWQLTGEDEDAMINDIAQLTVDCRRHRSGAVAAALLRHELAVLLLRIALLSVGEPQSPETAEGRTFARFRLALEDGHPQSRRVEDYAEQLGCSVRTLTRASLAGTGRSAKQVVDDRVALEARRLLACTDLSVAEIGRRLGFPEPTNFGRFFNREAGQSPGAFRAEARPRDPRVPAQRGPADRQ